jgi:hypothetical protein
MSGTTQATPLTPNSNCVAVGGGDSNLTTTVKFMAPANGIAWYTTQVSLGGSTTQSSQTVGNSTVKFEKGLTVQLVQTGGGSYQVFATGTIIDNNAEYKLEATQVYTTGAA